MTVVEFLEKHPTYRLLIILSTVFSVLAFWYDTYQKIFIDRPNELRKDINDTWYRFYNVKTNAKMRQEDFKFLIEKNIKFTNVDFRGANLADLNLEELDFSKSNFTDTNMSNFSCINCKLLYTELFIKRNKINFSNSNLSNSRVKVYFSEIDFSNANLSNASIVFQGKSPSHYLSESWAWSDQVPEIITYRLHKKMRIVGTDRALPYTGSVCDASKRKTEFSSKPPSC